MKAILLPIVFVCCLSPIVTGSGMSLSPSTAAHLEPQVLQADQMIGPSGPAPSVPDCGLLRALFTSHPKPAPHSILPAAQGTHSLEPAAVVPMCRPVVPRRLSGTRRCMRRSIGLGAGAHSDHGTALGYSNYSAEAIICCALPAATALPATTALCTALTG